MAGANVLELTDDNFDAEVINSDVPVLVDFWAEWCMPCKMLGPTIDELADEYAGKVKVGKVDTDNSRGVSSRYGITAIPTIMLFRDGEVVKKFVGLTSKKERRDQASGIRHQASGDEGRAFPADA
jgi:thioredoxin 1